VGNKFPIPDELVGKVRYAEVYDLRGRLLSSVPVSGSIVNFRHESALDMKKVFIVKFL
jgi:hypothetical protein